MKVICIKEGGWESRMLGPNASGPKYMEPVTVVEKFVRNGEDFYILAEYPLNEIGVKQSFLAKWFIPLSTIDETEFEREYRYKFIEEAGEVPLELFNQLSIKS